MNQDSRVLLDNERIARDLPKARRHEHERVHDELGLLVERAGLGGFAVWCCVVYCSARMT